MLPDQGDGTAGLLLAEQLGVLVGELLSFSTIWNWAVWPISAVPSVGLLGSWYFSWATSSLRNVSLPIALVGEEAERGRAEVGRSAGPAGSPIGVVIACSSHS